MLSLNVRQTHKGLFLMERDYPAQGISPFYTNICPLTPHEAVTLLQSRLIHPFMGVTGLDVPGGHPSDFLELTIVNGRPAIILTLPASNARPEEVRIEVPGFETIMPTALSDSQKRATFLANTGILCSLEPIPDLETNAPA
mgnify:CR=1 FL=1